LTKYASGLAAVGLVVMEVSKLKLFCYFFQLSPFTTSILNPLPIIKDSNFVSYLFAAIVVVPDAVE